MKRMKQFIYISLFLVCSQVLCFAQSIGTWKSYMAYHNTKAVAEANNNVFAVANNSLYSYGKEDQSIRTYSKPELSDMQIDTIAYNSNVNTLIIIYSNQNIDLLGEDGIYNIPHLMNNVNLQDKKIYSIHFHNHYAYLSTGFGVMLIDMKKKEITDTYRLNNAVYSTCIHDNHIYAATSNRVLYAPLNSNLLDPKEWVDYSMIDNLPFDSELFSIRQIRLFKGNLCFLQRNEKTKTENGIYYLADGNFHSLYKDNYIQNVTIQNDNLIAFTNSTATVYTSLTDKYTLTDKSINDISSLKDNSKFWIAAGDEGLKCFQKKGDNIEFILSGTTINSPKRDYADFMTFHNNKLFVAGGGRWTDRFLRQGTIMTYEDGQWYNLDDNAVAQKSPVNIFQDVTSIAVDPADETHYFASTWGEGVYEFKDNEFVKLHNAFNTNGVLVSALNNNDYEKKHYLRVEGLCFDKKNNLWMTNTNQSWAIKVLQSDGTWASLNSPKYSILANQSVVDKIFIRNNNHKWVNILRGSNVGIFVFDDKGTITDISDDETKFYNTFSTPTSEGTISPNAFYCMAEDNDGVMWIGTNLGPIRIPSPNRALDNSYVMYANRIVRTSDEGVNSWFLDGESVRSIAVDGGNRIWLGTQSSGLFIISADGQETYEHFTKDNSPLPSNYIQSIVINPETGEAFLGTDKGIVSYMGGATRGEETYSNVYAFPNPVRPEHNDLVTITGLVMNSNVKITDVNGNLIIQGKSLGGQFTWNCCKKNGERVATGVYLVLSATSDEDKKESVVTKIMVVK